MTQPVRLHLAFDPGLDETRRRRMDYAYRVFCAVYGYQPVDAPAGADSPPRLCYGVPTGGPRDIRLPARYRSRPLSEPAPPPVMRPLADYPVAAAAGPAEFPCLHGLTPDGRADWLAEIFEWLSAAHEYSITAVDDVGRAPYGYTLHGRYGLSPLVPWAAVAMQALNDDLRAAVGPDWPQAPIKPWAESHSFAVAATHDLDFLPLSVGQTLKRLAKNMAIAALHYRDPALLCSQAGVAARWLLGGRRPLGGLEEIRQGERQRGMKSSCYALCRQGHRRDANYRLADPRVRRLLDELARSGLEIGVHGSYMSLENAGGLAAEYLALAGAGHPAVGGRQHWLRYNGSRLFDELRQAGAWYDSSVGYPAQTGFRAGACFPYPPYDFSREAAYPLLEVPLVLMDTAVYEAGRATRDWSAACAPVLAAARAFGWGGVSVLWHNTVLAGGQLPRTLSELYWQLPQPDDSWLAAKELVKTIWPRYAAAGLLPGAPPRRATHK